MDPATLSFVGAAYGVSIAFGFSRRAWRTRSAPDALLALTLVAGIVAVLTIVIGNRSAPQAAEILEGVEIVATLLSGPLIYLYLRSVTGVSLSRRDLPHLLPAVAVLFVPMPPIGWIVLHQMAYTAAAVVRFVVHHDGVDVAHRLWPRVILPLMVVVHAAQMMRMAGVAPRDAIPVILVSTLIGAGGWTLTRLTASGARRSLARVVTDDDRDVATRLEAIAGDPALFRRADLALDDIARAAGLSPHEVSRLLNDVAGVTFHDLVARYRVEDARKRLLDPANDRFTIDAIAEAAGFGSRSTFYASFRRLTGVTPSEFRRRNRTRA